MRFPIGSYWLDVVRRWPSQIPFCIWWFLRGLAGHSFPSVDGGPAFQVLIRGTQEFVFQAITNQKPLLPSGLGDICFFVSWSKDPANPVQSRIKLHQNKSWKPQIPTYHMTPRSTIFCEARNLNTKTLKLFAKQVAVVTVFQSWKW